MSGYVSYIWKITCTKCGHVYRDRGMRLDFGLQQGSLIACPRCKQQFEFRRDENAIREKRACEV